MFTRVIVGTDLSLNSDRLVAGLSGLSEWGAQEVGLAHAADFSFRETSLAGTDSWRLLQEDRQRRLKQGLDCQRKVLENQGFRVTSQLVYGRPQEALDKLVAVWGADVLVIGLRRTALAREIIHGGAAFEILRRSSGPVLLISPDAGVANGADVVFPEKHILFATDFSPAANRAFEVLRELARQDACAVTLLHVLSRGPAAGPGDVQQLESMRRILAKDGARVRISLTTGDPAIEILHACEALNASLLLMGTHGKGAVGEFFFGSVSQAVARRARLPVLLIRENADEISATDAGERRCGCELAAAN